MLLYLLHTGIHAKDHIHCLWRYVYVYACTHTNTHTDHKIAIQLCTNTYWYMNMFIPHVHSGASKLRLSKCSKLNTHTHSHVQTYKHMYTGTHILPQLIHCSCIRQSYWPEARTVCLPFLLPIGPTPTTISDFWQMIWDHKSSVIVMLTKVQENGKVSTCAMHRKTPPTLHSSSAYSITVL